MGQKGVREQVGYKKLMEYFEFSFIIFYVILKLVVVIYNMFQSININNTHNKFKSPINLVRYFIANFIPTTIPDDHEEITNDELKDNIIEELQIEYDKERETK